MQILEIITGTSLFSTAPIVGVALAGKSDAVDVGRQLPALSSGEQNEIRDGIYGARKLLIADSEVEVIAKTRAITELPGNLCEDAFARVKRTPRYGDARSVWGMINGLTEASQSATENADKRTAIDLKAARLMGLLK